MESDAIVSFGAVNAEDVLLPLPERPQPLLQEYLDANAIEATNSYINIAMRWIEAIPWLDSIVSIVKSLHNPYFKHKNKPALIFSASPLSIDLPSVPSVEKSVKTNTFRLKI